MIKNWKSMIFRHMREQRPLLWQDFANLHFLWPHILATRGSFSIPSRIFPAVISCMPPDLTTAVRLRRWGGCLCWARPAVTGWREEWFWLRRGPTSSLSECPGKCSRTGPHWGESRALWTPRLAQCKGSQQGSPAGACTSTLENKRQKHYNWFQKRPLFPASLKLLDFFSVSASKIA